MNVEFMNRGPREGVERRASRAAARRAAERADAWDFLARGDLDGRHREGCVFALAGREPCSRDYDPLPYPEAQPAEPWLYAGTGVGTLYGLPGSEIHLWQLAGWNVVPGASR